MTQTGEKGGPFERREDWAEPGHGPVWSQKSDAVKAIKYAITYGTVDAATGQKSWDHEWCDAITFGQDSITIWINGTQLRLTAARSKEQYPPPNLPPR